MARARMAAQLSRVCVMNFDWLKTQAWQPFTFRGVSRFAEASLKRLFAFQFVVAIAGAISLVWFLDSVWFPVIDEAVVSLPETGAIQNGKLALGDDHVLALAQSRSLAILFDLQHAGTVRGSAHVQVEFGRSEVRVFSLLGYVDWPYPPNPSAIEFNRIALQPRWGAWRPPLLWSTFAVVLTGLPLMWWLLASLYFVPAWLVAFFSNRRLRIFGSWKLCSAALLPGACLMLLGIVLYGTGWLGPVELLVVQVAHWICGIVYCIGGVLKRPLTSEVSCGKNPFDAEPAKKDEAKPRPKPENPFQPPAN